MTSSFRGIRDNMPGVESVLVLGSMNVEEEIFGNTRVEPRDAGTGTCCKIADVLLNPTEVSCALEVNRGTVSIRIKFIVFCEPPSPIFAPLPCYHAASFSSLLIACCWVIRIFQQLLYALRQDVRLAALAVDQLHQCDIRLHLRQGGNHARARTSLPRKLAFKV
jgi:hypothetical protein